MGYAYSTDDQLQDLLLDIWREVLDHALAPHDNFFAAGGNSIKAAMIMNRLQQQTQTILHPVSIFDAPSVAELTLYLQKNYPQVFLRTAGNGTATTPALPLHGAQIAAARRLLRQRYGAQDLPSAPQGEKQKRAIFVLSAPRSGSTLLRVMLGGHPALFSPPELYLLHFATMAERQAAFTGRLRFMKEGLVRAIMTLKNCDATQALQIAETLEAQATPTKAVFQLLQSWLGERTLVDKTPPYAADLAVLARMEAEFADAFYIHLVRHPAGMIHSFAEARIDLATGDVLAGLDFSLRQKGELWWLISQQNIRTFLADVPAQRHYQIRFEDLVTAPSATVQGLCAALGIDFAPAMLQPYSDQRERMTDGIHPVSRLVGDPKFHTHQGISADAAHRWQMADQEDFLSAATWSIATELGYPRHDFQPAAATAPDREQWEF